MTRTTETLKPSIVRIVGVRIREVRTRLALSQDELARKAGITQAKVSDYELGNVSPSITNLDRIADALGVPIAELLKE